MPLTYGLLPPVLRDDRWEEYDVIASPEWFGAGHQSFRQVLVSRPLAELISGASTRDFSVRDVE
jgi:hypothetical protein